MTSLTHKAVHRYQGFGVGDVLGTRSAHYMDSPHSLLHLVSLGGLSCPCPFLALWPLCREQLCSPRCFLGVCCPSNGQRDEPSACPSNGQRDGPSGRTLKPLTPCQGELSFLS